MAFSPLKDDSPKGSRAPRPVMHVITDLDTGGAETMLANLVIAHSGDLHPPVVVSLVPGGSQSKRIGDAGLQVRDLGMARGRPSPAAVRRLANLIQEHRPRVIQSWMYHADLITLAALYLSGRRKKTTLLWGVRCSDMDMCRYSWRLRWVVRACALLSFLPNAVVANSHAGRTLHRSLGYRPRNFLIVPNGVDTSRFRPDPELRQQVRAELGLGDDDFVVGTAARVDAMKDYPTLLSAIARVPGVRGVVAGRGTESLADQTGLIRLGERDDLPRLFNGFDVFVLASAFGEGFSNALVEAMATGLPVITTDVGDGALIVGDCGVVVRPSDPGRLAEAISELKDDPAQCAQLGRDARQRVVDQFDLARAVKGFDNLHSDSRI